MRRIDTPTAAEDLFGPGKDGFRDGNPALAILATRLNAAFFNAIQEEIAGVVEGAGLALNPGDNTQLLAALRKLRGGAVNFGFWLWSAVGGIPPAGRVTLNNADPALASSLLIAESSAESLDYSPSLGMLRDGDTVSFQERDALDVSHRFRVTGPAVDHGAYREIPVSYVSGSGGAPVLDAVLAVLLTQASGFDPVLEARVTELEQPPFISSPYPITAGGPLTIPHGLGVKPLSVVMDGVCITAELGFSVDDFLYDLNGTQVNLNGMTAITADATNIYVRFGTSAPSLPNESTGSGASITPARWRVIFRASKR